MIVFGKKQNFKYSVWLEDTGYEREWAQQAPLTLQWMTGVNGKGAMVVLMKVHQPCYSASVLKRYDQHRVISILFTLGILWYPCCVHHTAFLWINSTWLISLTLF